MAAELPEALTVLSGHKQGNSSDEALDGQGGRDTVAAYKQY